MQESRHEHWVLMCAQIKIMFSVCNRQYHNGNNYMGLGVGKKKKKTHAWYQSRTFLFLGETFVWFQHQHSWHVCLVKKTTLLVMGMGSLLLAPIASPGVAGTWLVFYSR